jgi:hypothetical protein
MRMRITNIEIYDQCLKDVFFALHLIVMNKKGKKSIYTLIVLLVQ